MVLQLLLVVAVGALIHQQTEQVEAVGAQVVQHHTHSLM
jgi:hypothetical protein